MKVNTVTTHTPSGYSNQLTKYILANCKIPPVNGKFSMELHTPEQNMMIVKLKMKFQKYLIRGVCEAVRDYYLRSTAKLKVTNDIVAERIKVVNSDTLTDDEVIEKRIRQQMDIALISDKPQIRNFWEMVNEKLEISCSVSTKLFPIIPLSQITSKAIGEPVQFDCLVIGIAAPKLKVTEIITQSGSWPVADYNEKRDGKPIGEVHVDVQDVLVEEIFLKTQPGAVTRKINLKMYLNNISRYHSGDRLRVLGMYDINHEDVGKHEKRTVIQTMNVQKFNDESLVTLTPDDLNLFQDLAATQPDEYLDSLTESFVPNVLGNRNQKILILLAAVKGMPMFEDRSNIHCIFDDIPGTGKSDLLKSAVKFIQNSIFVDATSSTSRGLLYGQEDFEKTKILHEGVMLRYSMVFLDEFDKLDPKERQSINTAMQQQVATYFKVPFITSKNIDCTIIAAANPKNEKWLSSRSTMENLGPLEPAMISRCIVTKMEPLDNVDDFVDYKMNFKNSKIKNQVKFQPEQIKGLINHCREIIPGISEAGNKLLKQYLKSFKTIQEGDDFDLPIDKRKEVDVMRLCSALAKLLMKNTIDEWTVTYAVRLYKYTLSTIGMPTDAPTAQSVMTEHDIPKGEVFDNMLTTLADEHGYINETLLKSEMEKSGKWKTTFEIDKYIRKCYQEGLIFEPKSGYYRRI